MTNKTITLTTSEAWDLIDKLMGAAGRLSDAQEFGTNSFSSDMMNESKSMIFDVIDQLDPRK